MNNARWALCPKDGLSHAIAETTTDPPMMTALCGHRVPSYAPTSSAPHPRTMCKNCGDMVLNAVIGQPR